MSSKLDDYKVLETLSEGKYGLRQRISRISDGRQFECREINYKPMDDALKEMVVYEINSLRKLRHPNIVHHEDAIIKKNACKLYLITECGGNDTLQTLIDQHRRKKVLIKEEIIWTILLQFTQALHSLTIVQDPYRSQIFHRCLKPSSVYFDFETRKIKIGDFGLGLISKPYYLCPELQKLGLCNEKSDVWSMGCIIFEMCTLKRPFQELENDETQITDWKIGTIPRMYTRDLFSIIKFILTPDEETRPSPLMILHHPLIKAKKGGVKTANGEGLLETEFPLAKEDLTVIAEDSLEASIVSCSDLSLNHYLSMISDQDASATYIDDVDLQSIENGTAYPKATSSVIHASPSPFRGKFELPNSRRLSTEAASLSRRAAELSQMEAHLQRWTNMLEEKEQELAHKEKRLQLWETQLYEMQKAACTMSQPSKRRHSFQQRNRTSESSGVETDMDSTSSVYRGDSLMEPTVVRIESTKIPNTFGPYTAERRVRFNQHADPDNQTKIDTSSKMYAEQRTHTLEVKKPQPAQALPVLQHKMSNKLETDFIFMEEKSIPIAASRRGICKSPGQGSSFEAPLSLVNKENRNSNLQYDQVRRCTLLPPRPPTTKTVNTKSLSNDLRAKLKSHNLPGLR